MGRAFSSIRNFKTKLEEEELQREFQQNGIKFKNKFRHNKEYESKGFNKQNRRDN